ncbi:hypothetical protein TWF788_006924 [Orbilia oligospora]|uniref:Uncharacterized protein n=1 Tax=Orbilia oligospora TaxID=2813651 RepID=A0A7C8TTJ3_ORBOL|nr:hypothetical protein TWF788_006924 [Orbilia oligospora]
MSDFTKLGILEKMVPAIFNWIQTAEKELYKRVEQLRLVTSNPSSTTPNISDEKHISMPISSEVSGKFTQIENQTNYLLHRKIKLLIVLLKNGPVFPSISKISSDLIPIYDKIISTVENSITLTLDACYRLHTRNLQYTPVIIQAWNKITILFYCPGCGVSYKKPYKDPRYLGYPLIYRIDRKCSCENLPSPRYYQPIFPGAIHPSTLQNKSLRSREHHTKKWWVTVGGGISVEDSELDDQPQSQTSPNQDLGSLVEALERTHLDGPVDDFETIEDLRDLSKIIEEQIGDLRYLRQVAYIFGKRPPAISWQQLESRENGLSLYNQPMFIKEWIVEESVPEHSANVLLQIGTEKARRRQTAGLLCTSDFYYNVRCFSGNGYEGAQRQIPTSAQSSFLTSSQGASNEYNRADFKITKPQFKGLELKERAQKLSGYLEIGIGYDIDYECFHVEPKILVDYLHTYGVYYAFNEHGAHLEARNKPDHILLLYLSQNPCHWCQKFIRKVAEKFGLCIGWRSVPQEGRSSSVSMTYVNFCGFLGFDVKVNWL